MAIGVPFVIKEMIVVEGKEDTAAVLRAVQADTIETGGSALNQDTLQRIALAQQRRGVIIFTDPDHAGEKIRRMIAHAIPGCKHAFLEKEQALQKNGRKIGVEHASPEAIRQALENVKTEHVQWESEITWEDYLAIGLTGRSDSAARRKLMGKILGIGYANGKQFYKRCQAFRISKEEFVQASAELERRFHEDGTR